MAGIPTAPKRRCLSEGCNKLVVRGRCKQHTKGWDHSRTNEETGYGHAWRELRKKKLAANPRCEQCGARATQVDHIINKAAGGAWYDWSNLQSLCAPCHKRKTVREAHAGQRK